MHDHLDAAAAPADTLPEPGPLPPLATLFGQCAWFRTLAPEHWPSRTSRSAKPAT